MVRATVEKRLEILESRIEELQAQVLAARSLATRDWRRAVRKYAGDSDLQSIFAGAMKLRHKDRERARKRTGRNGSTRRKPQ